jgi:hypothetical protein
MSGPEYSSIPVSGHQPNSIPARTLSKKVLLKKQNAPKKIFTVKKPFVYAVKYK